MNLSARIEVFNKLSEYLLKDIYKEHTALLNNIKLVNPWFTFSNIKLALKVWQINLARNNISKWVKCYNTQEDSSKTVFLVMAGNIPMVGFHDLLSVLISGNKAVVKLSSDDNILIPLLLEKLFQYDTRIREKVIFTDKISSQFDSVIVTGNNDTARYFDYYFKGIRKIIRGNRSSVAILDGKETDDDLKGLADDIFTYFGLGCRNVSKIFIPRDYNIENLLDYFNKYNVMFTHQKYMNNYHYNRSLFLMQGLDFVDSGFFLMQESNSLYAPVSVIYYEFYDNEIDISQLIDCYSDKIQCIVSNNNLSFGTSQCPKLSDYADGIDVMKFLEEV